MAGRGKKKNATAPPAPRPSDDDGVSTNYGHGVLTSTGQQITFVASDALHAIIETPPSLEGRAITRLGVDTMNWTLA